MEPFSSLFSPLKKRYLLFCKEIKEKIGQVGAEFSSLGKEMGKRWKSLPKNEKEPYERQHAQLMIDYAKAIAKWVDGDPQKKKLLEEQGDSKKRKRAPVGEKKGKKKATLEKKSEKKPQTGYLLFQKEQRAFLLSQQGMKGLGNRASFGVISKQISNSWKNLTDKEKEEWKRKAAKTNSSERELAVSPPTQNNQEDHQKEKEKEKRKELQVIDKDVSHQKVMLPSTVSLIEVPLPDEGDSEEEEE